MTLMSTGIAYVVVDFLRQTFVLGKEPSQADTLRHTGTFASNITFIALYMFISELDLVVWVWRVQALAVLKRFTSSDIFAFELNAIPLSFNSCFETSTVISSAGPSFSLAVAAAVVKNKITY